MCFKYRPVAQRTASSCSTTSSGLPTKYMSEQPLVRDIKTTTCAASQSVKFRSGCADKLVTAVASFPKVAPWHAWIVDATLSRTPYCVLLPTNLCHILFDCVHSNGTDTCIH